MSVSELIKNINATVDEQDGISESERVELLAACKKLQGTLESPREKTFNYLMAVSDRLFRHNQLFLTPFLAKCRNYPQTRRRHEALRPRRRVYHRGARCSDRRRSSSSQSVLPTPAPFNQKY